MTDIDNLIRDLEAASEGSRELDVRVQESLAQEIHPDVHAIKILHGPYIPHCTTSLDAALTLVPEGWVWSVLIDYELPGRARLYNAVPGGIHDPPVRVYTDAATPTLALCIASLRAWQVKND